MKYLKTYEEQMIFNLKIEYDDSIFRGINHAIKNNWVLKEHPSWLDSYDIVEIKNDNKGKDLLDMLFKLYLQNFIKYIGHAMFKILDLTGDYTENTKPLTKCCLFILYLLNHTSSLADAYVKWFRKNYPEWVEAEKFNI